MTAVEHRRPAVSIGMPIKNCEQTLTVAVGSILAQTYRDWELLLIEDGSSDMTLAIAQSFRDSRIKVFSDGRSLGLVARLNQAIALSKGRYFARMDGDDVAYPERLARQVAYLEKHPSIDLVGAGIVVFGRGGTPLGKRSGAIDHDAICSTPTSGFGLAHPTYLGHLDWFRRHSYREVALRCEDQDLLLRSYQSSRFANLPDLLLGYREETILLNKLLTARRHFASAMFTEFCRQKRPDLAVWSVFGQAARAFVDWLAVRSGLDYRILRQRARPLTQEESNQWLMVWRSATSLAVALPSESFGQDSVCDYPAVHHKC
jgi:glycosyltransferase involved in cell wall biosynthesis